MSLSRFVLVLGLAGSGAASQDVPLTQEELEAVEWSKSLDFPDLVRFWGTLDEVMGAADANAGAEWANKVPPASLSLLRTQFLGLRDLDGEQLRLLEDIYNEILWVEADLKQENELLKMSWWEVEGWKEKLRKLGEWIPLPVSILGFLMVLVVLRTLSKLYGQLDLLGKKVAGITQEMGLERRTPPK